MSRSLRHGVQIASSDVELRREDVAALRHNYLTDPAAVEGMRLRRSARTGTLLTPQMLEAPPIVERGRQVTLIVDAGHLRVTARGKALENAGQGETVRVRNSASERVLEGVVIAPNAVQVGSLH